LKQAATGVDASTPKIIKASLHNNEQSICRDLPRDNDLSRLVVLMHKGVQAETIEQINKQIMSSLALAGKTTETGKHLA
jgi:hypothetical protein